PELREKMGAIMAGSFSDLEAVRPLVRRGMIDIIGKQTEAGIDIISDGELGKLGFGRAYYGRRISGLAARPLKSGESGWMGHGSGERAEFADFYKELSFIPDPTERAICSGPITYIGAQEVANDLQIFQSALTLAKMQPEEAFMCVLAPGWLEHFFHNEYYASDEQYLFALAD